MAKDKRAVGWAAYYRCDDTNWFLCNVGDSFEPMAVKARYADQLPGTMMSSKAEAEARIRKWYSTDWYTEWAQFKPMKVNRRGDVFE